MDIVYPYRATGTGLELRYSLRSLRNFPHDSVWVVGDSLEWLRTRVLSAGKRLGETKWENTRRKIRQACHDDSVSDPFVLMNDDIFVMEPVERVEPLYSATLRQAVGNQRGPRALYLQGLAATEDALRRLGHTDPLSYELHVPMVVHKAQWLEAEGVLGDLTAHSAAQMRSFYGNYWGIGGRKVPSDVKLYPHMKAIPEHLPYISTDNSAFNFNIAKVRSRLARLFPENCVYEYPHRIDTPPSSRSGWKRPKWSKI